MHLFESITICNSSFLVNFVTSTAVLPNRHFLQFLDFTEIFREAMEREGSGQHKRRKIEENTIEISEDLEGEREKGLAEGISYAKEEEKAGEKEEGSAEGIAKVREEESDKKLNEREESSKSAFQRPETPMLTSDDVLYYDSDWLSILSVTLQLETFEEVGFVFV